MHRLPPTSRRTSLGVLGIGLGVGLVGAGCSVGSLDPTSDDPTITPTGGATSTGPAADPDGDPDVALLDAAAVAVSTAHHVVRDNLRAHPGQRDLLAPLERLHRVHARELGGLRDVAGRVVDRAESSRQVLARVDSAEDDVQRSLVQGATRAESGALAQLLASMAASVAQHRTTLTTSSATSGGDGA